MYFYRTLLHKWLEQMTMEDMSGEALLACIFERYPMASPTRMPVEPADILPGSLLLSKSTVSATFVAPPERKG
jgi:hypothetical protein